jgi:hypothetical protein
VPLIPRLAHAAPIATVIIVSVAIAAPIGLAAIVIPVMTGCAVAINVRIPGHNTE